LGLGGVRFDDPPSSMAAMSIVQVQYLNHGVETKSPD
jgi:hypothetical protein